MWQQLQQSLLCEKMDFESFLRCKEKRGTHPNKLKHTLTHTHRYTTYRHTHTFYLKLNRKNYDEECYFFIHEIQLKQIQQPNNKVKNII